MADGHNDQHLKFRNLEAATHLQMAAQEPSEIENSTQIETQERRTMCSTTSEGPGQQLRAAIDKRYEELSHAPTGRRTDITDVVLRYIHPGMSFNDAEEILRCAGFEIGAHPGPTPPSVNRREDWYAVLASIAPFSTRGFFRIDVYVTLLPRNPGDYTSVEQVSSVFLVSSP